MRTDTLTIPLLFSCTIHLLVILFGSIAIHNSNHRRQDFLPIGLVDLPRTEPAPVQKAEPPPEIKKSPSPPPKLEKPITKRELLKPEQPAPRAATPVKEEPANTIEAKPIVTAKPEIAASLTPNARVEDGGSEAGAGNLSGKGDVAVLPGSGTAGGGGGTAASGLGRGSGAPGLPAPPTSSTNREAKPLQTVRASYPPMALRMGLEGDVTLRIEIDTEGKVTKAEIIKSGGMGFDDEALKAVKQSRFEPARKDGKNIPAEFTYIYRFRLQK